MINLKTDEELEIMREGGKILKDTLDKTLKEARPGISLFYLDQFAGKNIKDAGAESSFKRVEGYKWTICACVNDVVVHGIPNDYILQDGDTLGIDCGVYYKGFHTDAAWTKIIKNVPQSGIYDAIDTHKFVNSIGKKLKVKKDYKDIERFVKTGEQAFYNALKQVKTGNYIYDISKAIQDKIEGDGYSSVRTLVGHGVGRELHEEPEIPCFIKGEREKTPRIVAGMALAVEVIYNMGSYKVVYKGNDGWTIATEDGKISGLFESTVAVTSHGCIVLTPIKSELI